MLNFSLSRFVHVLSFSSFSCSRDVFSSFSCPRHLANSSSRIYCVLAIYSRKLAFSYSRIRVFFTFSLIILANSPRTREYEGTRIRGETNQPPYSERGAAVILCIMSVYHVYDSQQTQNICITFIKRRPNVFDVGPTLSNVIQMFCVYWSVLFSPSKRKTSSTLDQHCINGTQMFCVCWGVSAATLITSQGSDTVTSIFKCNSSNTIKSLRLLKMP